MINLKKTAAILLAASVFPTLELKAKNSEVEEMLPVDQKALYYESLQRIRQQKESAILVAGGLMLAGLLIAATKDGFRAN